jgi:Na+-transporting methylmalonyl-CoA/oxaloacetate decarboxylase beta subunit
MKKSDSNIIIEQNIIPIISFVVGASLLLLFASTKYEPLLYIGLLYVSGAILVNTVYLFYLILQLIKNWDNNYEIFIRIGITLSNIPISILFTYIVINHLL